MKKTIEEIQETPNADILIDLVSDRVSEAIRGLYPGRPVPDGELGIVGLSMVLYGAVLLKKCEFDSKSIADYIVKLLEKSEQQ